MASPSLPSISSLSTADEGTIISALDTLFEPSPDIHDMVLLAIRQKHVPADSRVSSGLPATSVSVSGAPFTSYPALINYVGALMLHLVDEPTPERKEMLHRILGSHPRLGAKKVDSAQSQAEQAQLNTGDADEAVKLKALNDEYESRFPGLRYVVFVNGRSRSVIMENMRYRINRGDAAAEEKEAIQAMVDIALDRARKLERAC
ncbi:Oxo-4-hydroxy-4-carboxy-5-ureidoimidazoline decarboxylase [Biscogniauxia marginata]|nr:Oxo-4-hydroxy-4-carboxy-5-ureidoimidazoline decarboxylase [Biscogniauxia marginata]